MIKEYSEEEVKALWNKIKPTKMEEEHLRVDKIEKQIKEIRVLILKKGAPVLYPELNILKTQIKDLQDRVEKLESEKGIRFREIAVRTFSPEKTREMVANCLKEKVEAYPSDIADELRLSIKDVMDAIRRLHKEGKIEELEE